VTCAQSAGLYMRIESKRIATKKGDESMCVSKYVFCDLHAPTINADDNTYV
jgi:hypothetical protein